MRGKTARKAVWAVDLAQRSLLLEERNAKAQRCKDAKVVDLAQRSKRCQAISLARWRRQAQIEAHPIQGRPSWHSVAFTFKRVIAPFYANESQPHFTQTGHSPILHKRVAAPFYTNGSQPHFTQTGRRPILRKRVADPFYTDGSQPHFTQTGHRPILHRRVADPFYEKTDTAFNSVSLRWLACGGAAE